MDYRCFKLKIIIKYTVLSAPVARVTCKVYYRDLIAYEIIKIIVNIN